MLCLAQIEIISILEALELIVATSLQPSRMRTMLSFIIGIILQLIMAFGRELVVLLTKPSMLGKFLVHVLEFVQRLEQRTFSIGSLRVKLILTNSIGAKIVGQTEIRHQEENYQRHGL